jgi:hypothetical protein
VGEMAVYVSDRVPGANFALVGVYRVWRRGEMGIKYQLYILRIELGCSALVFGLICFARFGNVCLPKLHDLKGAIRKRRIVMFHVHTSLTAYS